MGQPQVVCCGLDWSWPSCAAVTGPRGANSAWLPGTSRKGSRPAGRGLWSPADSGSAVSPTVVVPTRFSSDSNAFI